MEGRGGVHEDAGTREHNVEGAAGQSAGDVCLRERWEEEPSAGGHRACGQKQLPPGAWARWAWWASSVSRPQAFPALLPPSPDPRGAVWSWWGVRAGQAPSLTPSTMSLLAAAAGLRYFCPPPSDLSVKADVARAPKERPPPVLADGGAVLQLQALSLCWLPGQQQPWGGRPHC